MKTNKVEIPEYQLKDLKQQSRLLTALFAEGLIDWPGYELARLKLENKDLKRELFKDRL